MFTEFTQLTTQSDHRRQDLLADAANFRLAKLAKAGRRARRTVTPPTDPPDQQADRDFAQGGSAQRNDEAERRYPVSR
jgi:hypothetical protein